MTALDDYLGSIRLLLSSLGEEGLLRRMRLGRGIDLVSNDYLGLAEHPLLVERMREALKEVGSGAGGSRLLRGHRLAFERIEERRAARCGCEATLLFSSGYAANLGLLQAVLGADDVVFSDERNHASLIDGMRLSKARKTVYPHQDLDALEEGLRAPRSGRAFLVTESVFSMDGDLAPLPDLVALAEVHGAVVIVDEAHSTGLYGERGSGRVEALGLRERVLATIHTGGKALGSGGAWVAGSSLLKDLLVNRARSFIYSTAPLPVLASALDAALDVIAAEPMRRSEVHRKAALLRGALAKATLPGESPILPILVGTPEAALALAEGLSRAGFDARAVRPPTVPEGTSRLRVTARYPVADEDLLRFASEVSRLLSSRAA
jgi:8-amino-7-oxononanoate synthase